MDPLGPSLRIGSCEFRSQGSAFCAGVMLLAISANCLLFPKATGAEQRAGWLRNAKWGVMTHYLADWIADRDHSPMDAERWNRMIDAFDVERLADQLASLGAGYYLITIGQNSGYYLSPNATYDRLGGVASSKCSRRDLVADLYAALQQRSIPLMVYLPAGAPGGDHAAIAALDWRRGPYRNREFQLKWEAVIREWSTRWGDGVVGWWFDGCYWANSMYRHPESPNFASFAAATRAGNPKSIVAFNPGVYARILSITPQEDYTAGEINDPAGIEFSRVEDGLRDGTQLHILSYLGQAWGRGEPRFTSDEVVRWSRDVWRHRGAVTWDVPIETGGFISTPFVKQLKAVGDAARER